MNVFSSLKSIAPGYDYISKKDKSSLTANYVLLDKNIYSIMYNNFFLIAQDDINGLYGLIIVK